MIEANNMNFHLEALARQKETLEAELAECQDEARKKEINKQLENIGRQMVSFIPSNGLHR